MFVNFKKCFFSRLNKVTFFSRFYSNMFEITTVLENRSHKHFSDGYVVEIRTRTALGEV